MKHMGACVAKCPTLTYEADGRCLACHSQCAKGCFGPTAKQCEQCAGLKTGDTCVTKCPIMEYPDSEGMACEPCHPECSSVVRGCSGGSANACNACKNFKSEMDGSCVPVCPFGTYRDQSVCRLCNDECDGCRGPSPEQCDACRSFNFDGSCVRDCPAGLYPDAVGRCTRCNVECAYDCAGPSSSDCVPRTPGDNPCKTAQDGASCVPFCHPTSQFRDGFFCKSCAPECGSEGCTGPTARDCRACPEVDVDGACAASCPNNRYLAGAQCLPCDSQCTSVGGAATGRGNPFCSGPSPLECTQCRVAKRNSKCVGGCDVAEYIGLDQNCSPCDSQCDSAFGCLGPSPSQCKVCKNYRVDALCVAECPKDSMFATPGESLCRPCHPECSTASGDGGCPTGGSVEDCRRCRHVQEAGVCVDTCSIDHYPDHNDVTAAVGGVCKRCSSQCDPLKGCRGGGPDQCVVCASLDLLGTCVTQCPPLTFVNGKRCDVCDPGCLFGCSGSGPDRCTRQPNSFDQTATGLGCKDTATITSGGVVCQAACDADRYQDPDGVCRACHALCSKEYGCTGKSPDDCTPCPEAFYSYVDTRQQCAACNFACLAGCRGPGDNGCDACKGGRAFDGSCVSSCDVLNDVAAGKYYYTDVSQAEPVCLECHTFCAPGGCTGSGPQHCSNGCKAFTSFAIHENGSCVDKCGQNSYQTDFPVAQTCARCSPLCSGGCRDSSPASCVQCARVRSNGVCTDVCPTNEVPTSDNTCECPRTSAFVSASGICQLCSQQCGNGCFGPEINQCLPRGNGESGCRNVQMGDACAPSCADGMAAGLDRVCRFKCHAECGGAPGECFGTGPHQCQSCKTVQYRNFAKNRNECAETCPPLFTPDDSGVCLPCHTQCEFGCSTPDDPASCIGGCKMYHDQGACVGDCPLKRPYASGIGGKVCLEQCPVGKLFYNDTRALDGSGYTMPQLCVASCAILGDNRTAISIEHPNRCTTPARNQADLLASSSDVLASSTVAAIVVGCLAGVMIIVAVAVVSYQRRSGGATINPNYGVSNDSVPKRPRKGDPLGRMPPLRDSYTFEPDHGVQNVEYFDSSVLSGQTPRNLYPMGNDALFADYAEPSGPPGEYQTTHM